MTENKRKKVAIVGFAPSWKEAPFADQDTDIWLLNEMYKLAPQVPVFRFDRWFEIHDRNSPSKATAEHIAFLKQCPCPLYMWDHFDDLPSSIPFPKDEIIAWLEKQGRIGARYFTNTISWMIALAMYEGFEEIAIYGVNMSTDSEYGYQKPSCEYFIGLAEGMGIKVFIPQSSELLKCTQLYGFESNNNLNAWIKEQATELSARMKIITQQIDQARNAEVQAMCAQAELRGAQAAYKEVLKRRQ